MLQRAGNLKFQTIQGVLTHCDHTLSLTADNNEKYVLEAGRMHSARLDHLIGARVEVKGLVEPGEGHLPKIHVIYLKG